MTCRGIELVRVLFALAATMTLISVVLGVTVSPWFLALALFVAASQWLYVAAGACPASVVLSRVLCVQRGDGR